MNQLSVLDRSFKDSYHLINESVAFLLFKRLTGIGRY
jgi:hypothetical protein